MHPVLFKIGSIQINSYGFMISLGIAVAILLSKWRAKKRALDSEPIIDIAIYGIIGGVLGAKLLYILSDFSYILKNPSALLEMIKSGFVFYGAVIGGALAAFIYCSHKKIEFIKYFDIVAPSIAIAQGFGRIGCFFAGCCYGMETTSVFGVLFKEGSFGPDYKVVPTQIFSSIGDFLIAAILLYFAAKPKKDGKVAGFYMILYSIGRFIIEFFRGDPRGSVAFLSTSQFICIFILFGGLLFYNREEISKLILKNRQ